MSDTLEPLIQECATCGTLIDVSEEEPLALMHCPTCGAAMRVQRSFGQFALLEVLGAGGMGTVYRAQDTALNRSVALKLLRREYSEHPEFIQQFAHEAALTAQINHPNVVKVYSTGSDHGHFFIAMELVDKGSLDDLMVLQGRVGEAQVLEVGLQAAQGLRAAYLRGLMHRDVKPGNILFSDAHHAKIVDFGLAAPLGADAATGGEVWGTPYYVAPEKLENPPVEDFRSDIYSLGATLFHAIAGRAPYEAEDASMVALKHLKSQPVSLQAFAPDVSSSTAYVINRALAKDMNQRYQSYDELIQHLEYALAQLRAPASVKAGTKPLASGVRPGAPRPRPRVVMESAGSQRAMSFITLLMFAALAYGGWFLYQHRDRFLPKRDVQKANPDKARQAAADFKTAYETARRQFIDGKATEAAEALHKLELENPNGPQPTLDWVTFHAGLATAASGKLDDSRSDWDKLAKRGPWSPDPNDTKLADFMTKVSKMMIDENSTSADVAKDFDKTSYECVGLLALAIKDWELGEFDDAIALFRQYDSSTPDAFYRWAGEYRTLSTAYVENYDVYKAFAEKVSQVGEPEKAKPLLPKLHEELTKLKLKGRLEKKAQAVLRKEEQKVADYDAEQHKAVAEMESSDEDALKEIKGKADPLAKEFDFKAAVKTAKSAQAITDKGKKDKANLIKRYDWLDAFKSTLTSDLNTTPFPGGVRRKQGVPIAGAVTDANEKSLIVKPNPSITQEVPWVDASYEGILAIAQNYLRADLPADRLADRLWYLGVFSEFQGKTAEAAKFFTEAVKRKKEYEDDWKLFPDVPNPNAPAAPAATAETPKGEAPKADAPKADAPKTEEAKPEPAKPEAAKPAAKSE